MARMEDFDLDVEFGAVDFGLGVPLEAVTKSAEEYRKDEEDKRCGGLPWNPVKGDLDSGQYTHCVHFIRMCVSSIRGTCVSLYRWKELWLLGTYSEQPVQFR
jgi:hypothetical protein